MEPIAIYYQGTIVYWSSIIIGAAIIAGYFIGLAFYLPKNKYSFGYSLFYGIAIVLALVSSRWLHWYCYQEQYESLELAMTDFTRGGFLMPAVLVSVWLAALIASPTAKGHSRFQILDAAMPALAFITGVIKFADIYSDLCRGKLVITNPDLQRLPFAIITPEGDYRLATFFLTAIAMAVVTVLIIIFFYVDARHEKKPPLKEAGHTFRIYLVLYGMVEIVMDSTRYDAAHFSFPGEALAGLNKGMGFMGFSQLIGAICCLYVFIYYLVMTIKANKWKKLHILPIVLFVLGLAGGGTAEYLVQRYFDGYVYWYAIQITGVLLMGASVLILYIMGLKNKTIDNPDIITENIDESSEEVMGDKEDVALEKEE